MAAPRTVDSLEADEEPETEALLKEAVLLQKQKYNSDF